MICDFPFTLKCYKCNGHGSVYTGAAASSSAVHVTYDGSAQIRENGGYALEDPDVAADFAEQYQNTNFTINEYWGIGQMANLISRNGSNPIHFSLSGGAVRKVTGPSLIDSLTLIGSSKVAVPEGITLTFGDSSYTARTLTAENCLN